MKTKIEKNMEDIMDLSPDVEPLKNAIDESKQLLEKAETEMELIVGEGGDYSTSQLEIDGDYKFARDNMRQIINSGQMALNELSTIASVSESPRAFEVLTQMMKMLSEANKDLLEIQKRVQELRGENEGHGAKTVHNNAFFVGSTSDLQKHLKAALTNDT